MPRRDDNGPETVGADAWRRSIAELKAGFQAANRVVFKQPPKPGTISGDPQVSVIVIAHNDTPLLVQTLSSVQQQDFLHWECVIVDDASTHHDLDVARAFADQDPRFRIVWHDRSRGRAASRNTGLLVARCPIATFLDGGDVLFPSSLRTRLGSWAGNPVPKDFAGVYCDWRRMRDARIPKGRNLQTRTRETVTAAAAGSRVPFVPPAPLFRTGVVRAMGGLNEHLGPGADADLWRRVLREGYFFDYVRHVGVGYREPGPRASPQSIQTGGQPGLHRRTHDLRDRAQPSEDHGLRLLSQRLRIVDAKEDRTPSAGAVLLVPQVRYHVEELGPLADELRRRGRRVVFMPTSVAGKLGQALRGQLLAELTKYTDTVWEWDPNVPEDRGLAAVVVLNDWGTTKELVVNAQRAGTRTFAKIEGVQDFGDHDTGRERRPYRTADVVLGQGRNDSVGVPDAEMYIVGNSRLEALARGPRSIRERLVAINLNFTYDVLVEHANEWLHSVVQACHDARVDYVICPHPAQYRDLLDRDLLIGKVAREPIRHVLLRAGILLTRFSTVVYEAMAKGVPVIYHNPHGEHAWNAVYGAGDALPFTRSTAELSATIQRRLDDSRDYRILSAPLFSAQVDVKAEVSAAERAADVITRLQ